MIRPIYSQDMDKVLDIWLHASIQARSFISAAFWRKQLGDMRNRYLPASTSYVLEVDGAVCGFYSLHGDALAALFVAPGKHGAGLGSLLLADAQARRTTLELTVYSANHAARRFYERHGFVVLGEQQDEHTGHLETRMRWSA